MDFRPLPLTWLSWTLQSALSGSFIKNPHRLFFILVALLFWGLFFQYTSLANEKSGKCNEWATVFTRPQLDQAKMKAQLSEGDIKKGIVTHKEKFEYFPESHRPDKTTKLKVMTWNIQMAGPDIFVPGKESHRLKLAPQWYNKL